MTRTWQTLIVVASAAAALAIGLGAQAGALDADPATVIAAR
ncbi:hypothetical protein [Phenylobacterium sp.]|jgi:hypothetical protein